MGLFGSNNPFTEPLAKLTSELNTETDWGAVLELCDQIKASPKGPQDFSYVVFHRLSNKIPHVSMQTLTVLDACVNNCGKEFHKEMASQSFTENIREFLYSYKNPKVVTRMKYLVRKWAEEFKNDPALAHFVSIYYYLRGEGMDFPEEDESDPESKKKKTTSTVNNPDAVASQQEADDIAKAIEASLKEEKNKRSAQTTLYPSVVTTSSAQPSTNSTAYSTSSNGGTSPKRKVKALYDFEAAEDNELTFHTGDIISILDDSDVNWWKGEGANGVGLFPANFVTSDLKAEPEPVPGTTKVSFSDADQVKEIIASEPVLAVDETLIDRTLLALQNTDPEQQSEDSPQLLRDEETCRQMEKLIDSKLEMIDREHLDLTMLNEKILEALNMYDSLMKETPSYAPQVMKQAPQQPNMYAPNMYQQPPLQQPYQMDPSPMGPPMHAGMMAGNAMPLHYNNMYQPQMAPPQQQVGQPQQQPAANQQDPQQPAFPQSSYPVDPNQQQQSHSATSPQQHSVQQLPTSQHQYPIMTPQPFHQNQHPMY